MVTATDNDGFGLANLRQLLRGPAPLTAEELCDYKDVSRAANIRNGKAFLGSLGILNLLWWLSDPWIFARMPKTILIYAGYRPVFSLQALVGYVLLDLLTRRRLLAPRPILIAVASFIIFEVACMCGEGGGPSTGWFSFLYLPLLAILSLSCSVAMRSWLAFLGLSLILLGYFQNRVDYWSDPFTPASLSFLFFVWIFSIGAGEVGERLRKETFLLRRTIGTHAAQLRDWNERLEARILEQTRDLRALTAYNDSAREDERTRIARELHDELGQELTAMRYALKGVKRRYQRDTTTIAANLDELEALLARTASTTRNIVTDLRPRVLDDLGLLAAAEWLLRRTQERAGLECRLTAPDSDVAFPEVVSTAAFRILQESLTNVARHAAATHVEVVLSHSETAMLLTIADDGVGIGAGRSGGMGLIGMRERARALGGELIIEAAVPQGTIVRARLPLRNEMAAIS